MPTINQIALKKQTNKISKEIYLMIRMRRIFTVVSFKSQRAKIRAEELKLEIKSRSQTARNRVDRELETSAREEEVKS